MLRPSGSKSINAYIGGGLLLSGLLLVETERWRRNARVERSG